MNILLLGVIVAVVIIVVIAVVLYIRFSSAAAQREAQADKEMRDAEEEHIAVAFQLIEESRKERESKRKKGR